MAHPKPFYMPITNERKMEKVELHAGYRTVEQFEVVRKIVESSNFDFCCGHEIFVPGKIGFSGPFCFLWYDKKGILHLTRIGKRGKILREVAA